MHVLVCAKTDTISTLELASTLSLAESDMYTTLVPKYPAYTKDHFTQSRALWPINYHPITPPPALTDDEKGLYRELMKRAIELGKLAAEQGNAPVGMVIVDKQGNIVGESGDNRKAMFLDHCCFSGIRNRSFLLQSTIIKRSKNEDPYLCTDCDVILTREPCVMYLDVYTLFK